MKKIFFFFAILISFASNAQVRVCQLPQVNTTTLDARILIERADCGQTQNIKVSDFFSSFGIDTGSGGGTTVDTTFLSNRINVLTNSKVDTIYKNTSRDSLIYTINGRRHAIKDSVGDATAPSATIIINQDDAADMEAGLSTYPVENQWYVIQNLSITGVDQIRTIGVIDQTTGNGIFSKNAEAYVTALSRYVPCTYDVGTNTARFDYLLWAGHISQTTTDAPTVNSVSYNISGETPTFGYTAVGIYTITFTGARLVSGLAVKHFSFVNEGDNQGFYTVEGNSDTEASIKCYRSGALTDDRLIEAYIEIRLVYTP